MPDGSALVVEIRPRRPSPASPPAAGRAEVVADLGGGPNGAAIGPDGAVYVVNNGGFLWSEIERDASPVRPEDPQQRAPRLHRRLGQPGRPRRPASTPSCTTSATVSRFLGPNDIVFDTDGGFWFTDFGKTRARTSDRGGLYYARADGSSVDVRRPRAQRPQRRRPLPRRRPRLRRRELHRPAARVGRRPGPARSHVPQPTVVEATKGHFDSLAVEAGGNVVVAAIGARALRRGARRLGPRVRRAARPVHHQRLLRRRRPAHRYVTLSGSGRLVSHRLAPARPARSPTDAEHRRARQGARRRPRASRSSSRTSPTRGPSTCRPARRRAAYLQATLRPGRAAARRRAPRQHARVR